MQSAVAEIAAHNAVEERRAVVHSITGAVESHLEKAGGGIENVRVDLFRDEAGGKAVLPEDVVDRTAGWGGAEEEEKRQSKVAEVRHCGKV